MSLNVNVDREKAHIYIPLAKGITYRIALQ